MPVVFSHVEYCDMHFVYGFCDGNACAAVDEYQRRFPDRRIPSRGVFSRIPQTMRETGCLPSVAMQSEREVVPLINTRENILEMVCHICSCGDLYMTKMYILIMITENNIWNHGPCSTYGFVPVDNSTSPIVKRHFIHR